MNIFIGNLDNGGFIVHIIYHLINIHPHVNYIFVDNSKKKETFFCCMSQSPVPSIDSKNGLPTSDENLNQEC